VAASPGYLLRETAGNLRRHMVMTLAAVLTMAVSLAALGGVLIMREAVNTASLQWRGGVQLAIFLQPGVSHNESVAIGRELSTAQGVKTYRYVDQSQAFKEFKTIFGGEPDLVNAVSAKDMPSSYRVVPTNASDVSQLGRSFNGQPGVLHVSYAQQEIDSLLNQFRRLRLGALIIATLVMAVAVVLIVNTLQLAIFARRREVAVMKLVGATNWFIRIPFMLEGLVHGIVGAAIAFFFAYLARNGIASLVGSESLVGQTQKLYVTPHEALLTGIVVLVVGAVVGALGSAFAVRRFLAV
jgi:cell division transport system permease protein